MPVEAAVLEAMLPYIRVYWADAASPSSVHPFARIVGTAIATTRTEVAEPAGARPAGPGHRGR